MNQKEFKKRYAATLARFSETQLFQLTWTRAVLGGETSYIAWNMSDDQDVIVDMPNTHPLREFLTAVVLELLWRCEQQPDREYGNLLALDVLYLEQDAA